MQAHKLNGLYSLDHEPVKKMAYEFLPAMEIHKKNGACVLKVAEIFAQE